MIVKCIIGCLAIVSIGGYHASSTNTRPIIGILSQESFEQSNNSSYIAASYVKYIESAGARVVPILCNSSTEQLTKLFNSINGVLFPGGGASLNSSNFFRSGKILYDLAVKAYDDNGDHFPIWGTCLGFEMLCVIQHGSQDLLSGYDSDNYTIPLNLMPDRVIASSRLFSFYNSSTLKWLSEEPLTMNNHVLGVSPKWFNQDKKLKTFFNVLSTNVDRKNKEFVSTIEAFHYPIYGVQWHPEKNIFEWTPREVMKHSYRAVRIAQTAANFFVQEARKNNHCFDNEEEERDSLIYNYNPVYSSKKFASSSFDQVYEFPCC